jgi:DNA-binding transcriptional ArsR family regulator
MQRKVPRKRAKSAARQAAPVFSALGDQRRLRLVARLSSRGPASITGLAFGAGVSRQAVTKHLQVLARAGLVRADRQGRETIYQLDPKPLDQATQYLDVISRQWDHALNRLKLFVENG